MLRLGQHDLDLVVVRQIIERGDDRPAVHLALVDLLRAVIEAGRVAEADRVGGGEQAEGRMRLDHPVLVEQRQPAGRFQHALDHEHHVRAAGVVFVEAERDIVLQRPGQNAVAEFGHLHAVADHDRVLADQIDAADMAVEIDAHARPVEPRGDLLDMGRFAGAVIAGDDDAAVVGKAGEDGERRRPVEPVVGVEVGHMLVRLGIGRNFHVAVDAEHLPDRNLHVRQAGHFFSCESHCTSVTPGMSRAPVRPSPAVGCHAKFSRSARGRESHPRDPAEHSAETRRLQVIVGLDDLPQPVLGRPVAAVGVGMMALHQHLEPGLDIGALGIGFKAEHIERAALGIEYLAALAGGLAPDRRGRASPAEQAERILGRPAGTPAAWAVRLASPLAADRAHLPGRSMPGEVFLLVFRDGVVAHAGEKIIRIIVFAHVFQTEAPVFGRAQPALRRAVRGGRVARGHSQAGSSARSRRSWSGLTRMRSKSGEFATHRRSIMRAPAMAPARLDRRQKRTWFAIDRDTHVLAKPPAWQYQRSDHGKVAQGFRAREPRTSRTNRISTKAMRDIGQAAKPISDVYIVSEAFRGKSRLERHRMINAALASELAGGVHALAIHAAAPGETF